MLGSQLARQVAANDGLTNTVRYAGWRWAELLDPATHFSRASCAYIDPMTGLEQFESLLEDYMHGRGTRWPEVVEWMRMMRDILGSDPNVDMWAGPERKKLDTTLNAAAQSVPNKAPPWKKEKIVQGKVGALRGAELAAFRVALLSSGADYRTRLLAKVCGALTSTLGAGQWTRFDRDLAYLASRLLAEGRDPVALIWEVLEGWTDAADEAAAAQHLEVVAQRSPHRFAVAVSLSGVRRLRRVGPFGASVLSERSRWPGKQLRGPEELRSFVADRSGRAIPHVCVLLEVDAHDHSAALAVGWERADRIADHAVAEHRLNDVGVAAGALVLCRKTGELRELPADPSPVGQARLYASAPVTSLSGSLRLNRLARHSQSAVLAVSLHWVAMEGAANGAPKEAGTFIPPNAGAMMALAAARYQLTAAWHVLRDAGHTSRSSAWAQVEAWLSVTPQQKQAPLGRWVELLRAAGTEGPATPSLAPSDPVGRAGTFLRHLAAEWGPFHLRQVLDAADRLANAGLLSNWCVAQEKQARLNLQRIRFMRHRALHRADLRQDHAIALRQAARDLTDGIYEVLKYWLTGRLPWEAMRDAQAHYRGLVTTWSQQGRTAAKFDPERLVAP